MNKFVALGFGMLVLALAPAAPAQDLPEGKGRETLKKVCTQCHDIESVPRLRYSKADWTSLVYSMKDMGADATGAELDEIIDYLTLNFGKGGAPKGDAAKSDGAAVKKINVNSAAAMDMETGLGLTTKDSEAIVAYRTKNGNFKSVDDLLKVDGVDAAKIQAAKDKIDF